MIYIVEILKGKYVKVGYTSNNVEKRISQLQTASPFKISTVFTIEGNIYQEKQIHLLLTQGFASINVPIPPNEWYKGRHPFMIKFLKELRVFGANGAITYLNFIVEEYLNNQHKSMHDIINGYNGSHNKRRNRMIKNLIDKNKVTEKWAGGARDYIEDCSDWNAAGGSLINEIKKV